MNHLQRLVIIGAAVFMTSLLLFASPASAHTGFESSEPTDGATTDAEVSEIIIRFSGVADPAGEGFVILDPAGKQRIPDSATPNADKTTWTLGFDPPLATGVVGVRWTVQAPDAHPIDGSFSFTIDAPPAVEAVEQEPETQPAETIPTQRSEDPSPGPTEPGGPVAAQAPSVQDLDEFLTGPVTAPNAEGVGAFGRLLGLVGTMLGIGGLAFAAHVIRDHRPDVLSVLKAVRYAAVAVVIGTAIDLIAHLAVANNGWSSFWSDAALEAIWSSAYGLAVALRAGAGVLLFVTARMASENFASSAKTAPQRAAVFAGGLDQGEHFRALEEPEAEDQLQADDGSDRVRISPAVVASVLALLASFTFDGHTVTEGNRWITGAVDMIHVVAGSIWAGGVVAFAVVLWRRHRQDRRLNALELAIRFSVVAGAALAVAGLAGSALAVIILDSASELWSTPWGRLLITKFAAVAAAASLGTYNHFIVIPWLEERPTDDARSIKLRNTATVEALLLVAVITITAFLVGAAS